MTTLRTTYVTDETAHGTADGDALERLRRLFAPPSFSDPREAGSDAHVSRMIQGFLSADDFSSQIEFRSLVGKFLGSHIPAGSCEVGDYLDRLFDDVVAHSTRTSSPRFIGHMTSALPYFVRPLGRLLAALNQNVVKAETAKAFSPFERQTLAMIHRLIFGRDDDFYDGHVQNPESTLGVVTSGGTLANLTALWCARNRSLGPRGDFGGVESEGMAAALEFYGHRGAVVVGPASMHYSFDKAADVLGLGRENLIKVPAGRDHRIEVSALREAVGECRARGLHVIAVVGGRRGGARGRGALPR
jgi:glutamate decarboxylase